MLVDVSRDRFVWTLCAVLGGCTPEGGVSFEAPESGVTEAGSGGSGGGGSSGEGGVSGLPPPSTTLPPPSTTSPSTSSPTSGAEETGDDTSGGGPSMGTLIAARAKWRVLASASPPASDWAAPGFDDSAWLEGAAPVGDEGDVATVVDAAKAPVGVYLRGRFVATPGAEQLMMYLRRGDGAAVYLNGTELLRTNLPGGTLGSDTLAEEDLKGDEVLRYLRFAVPGGALKEGENVVGVALRRAQSGQVGLGFDMQLDAIALASLAKDELRAQWRTRSYGGEYARENVGAAWVETAAGGFVRTLIVWAEVRREHLVRWQSTADGDVVDAITGATRGGHRTSEVVWDLRDAQGQAAAAGEYRLMFEFTEADSNKGDPAGPRLEVPFTLGGGPSLPAVPASPHYRDVLVVAP